jgi:heat shock protein HslJ
MLSLHHQVDLQENGPIVVKESRWSAPVPQEHWRREGSAMFVVCSAFTLLFTLFSPALQATPVPPEDTGIPAIVWELIELPGHDGKPVEIAEPARYTIQFLPDGVLAIGADCNRVGGTHKVDGEKLQLELTRSTLALCPPDSQADPFQRLVENATSFSFDPDGHLLLKGDEGTLRFRPMLLGVVWEWQEFQGSDDSQRAPKNPEDYTLTFLPDGKLAILADCNRAMGTYTLEDNGVALNLKVGGVTRMLCPEGSLMHEFLRDLDDVSSHVFRDGKLYLALRIDAGIMEFEARYVAPDEATPEVG